MRVAIIRREPKVALSMDVYADNLVAGLKALRPDWEIREIEPQPWSDNPENLWHTGNPVRKYYERFYNHPRQVNRLEADIFHIIDHSDGHIAYGLKKAGKNVVVTCHDLVQYIYPEILKNEARFPWLSMGMWQYSVKGIKSADRTIAISSNTAQDISKWLQVDSKNIEVILNGVELDFSPSEPDAIAQWRSQYTTNSQEICLLNVGTNHHRKNIETVFKVVKNIAEQSIPVRLWKVGEDFYPEQKQYIEEHNLAPHITLVNNPDRASLLNFYQAADLLLAPSLYEGFGLTILEAMACRTPTITSNVSALPEVAGDAAMLFEPQDVAGISAAVLKIHQDPELRESLIQKGLARVQEFTWAKTAAQTAAVYEQVVAAKRQMAMSGSKAP